MLFGNGNNFSFDSSFTDKSAAWASKQRRNIATSVQSIYMGDEVGSVGMYYTDPRLCALNLPGKEAQNSKQEGIGCRQLCLRSTSMWHLCLKNLRNAALAEIWGPSTMHSVSDNGHQRLICGKAFFSLAASLALWYTPGSLASYNSPWWICYPGIF